MRARPWAPRHCRVRYRLNSEPIPSPIIDQGADMATMTADSTEIIGGVDTPRMSTAERKCTGAPVHFLSAVDTFSLDQVSGDRSSGSSARCNAIRPAGPAAQPSRRCLTSAPVCQPPPCAPRRQAVRGDPLAGWRWRARTRSGRGRSCVRPGTSLGHEPPECRGHTRRSVQSTLPTMWAFSARQV